jgi:O-antigen/teichoic acid export membrane protein
MIPKSSDMSLLERTVPAKTQDVAARPSTSGIFRLLHLADRWRFVRNVATLSAGTALAQSVNIILTPAITRLYSPTDLGVLGLFTSFLGVATVATSLKYELGIVSAATEDEGARLTWASMLLTLPLSLLCGGALYATVHFAWLGYGALPAYAVPLMVATLALTGTFTNLRYWAIRQDRFGIVAKGSLVQQVTRSVLQTVLGFAGAGPAGLLSGELLGRGAGIGSLLRHAWPALKRACKAPRREIVATLSASRKLAIYSLPSSLIDTLAMNMLVPLLIALYGSSVGGQFALMQKVLALPLALIATSVADTFHSRLAVCAREEPCKMVSLFTRTSVGLFLIGLGPALVLFFAGERLFGFVFGQPWATAGMLASITAPFFLAQMVVSPLSRLVFVLNGQETKLIYDVLLMTGMLLTFGIARTYKLNLIHTVWAITLVNTFAYIFYYLVLLRIVARAKLDWSAPTRQEP